MSEFSSLLEKYIKRNKLSVKSAADLLEINRTTLQHIISGDRNLKNQQAVELVGKKLMLTADELRDFVEKYKISVMGEEVYQRRCKVRSILALMERGGTFYYVAAGGAPKLPEPGGVMCVQGEMTLNRVLSAVLAAAGEGEAVLLAQPSERLTSLIGVGAAEGFAGSLKHIFCMDNNFNTTNERNLDILYYSFATALLAENYTPMYYYDNISAHINSSSLLPFCLVTEQYAVTFDSGMSEGIVCADREVIKFYQKRIRRYESGCETFFTVAAGPAEMIRGCAGLGSSTYNYCYQPCILPVTPHDIIERCISLPPEEKMIYFKYINDEYGKYLSQRLYSMFSEEGLKKFVENGTVSEIPENTYRKPSPEERREVLRCLERVTAQDIVRYRAYKDGVYSGSGVMTLNLTEDFLYFIYRDEGRFKCFRVTERGLVHSFEDYLSFMIKDEMLCDREQTLAIIRKYI